MMQDVRYLCLKQHMTLSTLGTHYTTYLYYCHLLV